MTEIGMITGISIWNYFTVIAMTNSTQDSAHNRSHYAEEPDEAKVSCPVLKWQWAGRPAC